MLRDADLVNYDAKRADETVLSANDQWHLLFDRLAFFRKLGCYLICDLASDH